VSERSATTHEHVRAWLSGYERAWRTPGTTLARELFADDASYQLAPYDPPIVGGDAIAAMWERERQGPDEQFTMESEIVAVEGDTAVVRVSVAYGTGTPREYRDLWVLRFDSGGRCLAFEEWPFWPGQDRVAPQ
jgi:ketosteroid isomerase-like protein